LFIGLMFYSQLYVIQPDTALMDRIGMWFFLASCVFCFLTSAAYHLLGCHSPETFQVLSRVCLAPPPPLGEVSSIPRTDSRPCSASIQCSRSSLVLSAMPPIDGSHTVGLLGHRYCDRR